MTELDAIIAKSSDYAASINAAIAASTMEQAWV